MCSQNAMHLETCSLGTRRDLKCYLIQLHTFEGKDNWHLVRGRRDSPEITMKKILNAGPVFVTVVTIFKYLVSPELEAKWTFM